MDTIYLVMVIFLFMLAISDLIVGVSNDAVNFLNSAIGAKVASFKTIMVIAAIGVLVGATFSSGMMEVARKGIFHPSAFYFHEILLIFLAVMITDVLLLDMFNTFGLPTSTTVSIVFELLGASVGISIIKLYSATADASIYDYINTDKALAIVAGILLSVIVAFTLGAVIQYLSRLLFSFNFEKKLKYFGSVYGGIAFAAITYFILVKGAKSASFITPETLNFIKFNSALLIVISFAGWSIILQLLTWLFRINVLKLVVLVGTFALAMAFAGNDLVNFIGVPLAGLSSYLDFTSNPGADPDFYLMTSLQGKVQTPTFLLLIAGLIMVLTLWFNKKARSVVKTTVDLSRQSEGTERFKSSAISRGIVSFFMTMNKGIMIITPYKVQTTIQKQFVADEETELEIKNNKASFDLVRASVNLVVASIIISFATSLTLPLSTTYVAFMVAMGSSLSDKAWGRESAVYRVTGVLSVIGGWFMTALVAFTVALIMALIFNFGGLIAIIIMMVLAAFFVIRTHTIHKRRVKDEQIAESSQELKGKSITELCAENVSDTLTKIDEIYSKTINYLIHENLSGLKKTKKKIIEVNKYTSSLKNNLNNTVSQLSENDLQSSFYYIQVLDYLREVVNAALFITKPAYEHVANNHRGFNNEQISELETLKSELHKLIIGSIEMISHNKFDKTDQVDSIQKELILQINKFRKNQILRIRNRKTGTKSSMLFLNLLQESKNIALYTDNIVEAQENLSIH